MMKNVTTNDATNKMMVFFETLPGGCFHGGEQTETLPGGTFHGGEQTGTLPGGTFH